MMFSTKKLNASIHFDMTGFGHAKINVFAESEPSIALCYSEIVKKKKLGEGGYFYSFY